MGNYPGSIPVLSASGESLAEAWENSVWMVHKYGCDVRTEYDPKDGDGNWLHPPSKDCTMMVTVLDPSSEPFIHRAFPGGLEDLEEYRQEVVDGIKDHWVRDPYDHEDKRWEYTYHARLTNYFTVGTVDDEAWIAALRAFETAQNDGERSAAADAVRPLFSTLRVRAVDQLEEMVKKLAKVPYTRRANAVTWQPWCDPNCYDPPCLQSVWCRALEDDEGVLRFNMNVRLRSWDAYDAAFMNMFAFIGLQEHLAARLADKMKREVKLGRYCGLGDSYHIYGRRLQHFKENFLKLALSRPFEGEESRTWTREFAEPVFAEARSKIKEKIARQDAKYAK